MSTPQPEVPPAIVVLRIVQWIFPWAWVRLAMKPRNVYRTADPPEVMRLRFLRILWYLGAVLFIASHGHPVAYVQYPNLVIYTAFGNAVLALAVVPVVCVAAIFVANPDKRGRAAVAILRPLARLALLVTVIAALFYFDILWYSDGLVGNRAEPIYMGDPTWGTVGQILWQSAKSFWLLGLLLAFVWFTGRYFLAISDAHPALEPIATIVVTWVIYLANAVPAFAQLVRIIPPEPAVLDDSVVAALIKAVGVLLLTGICGYELRKMQPLVSLRSTWK